MRIFVLGSGSSGNCLVVEAAGERLLLDAGMGPTRAVERMRSLGSELVSSHAPLGLFVTHEHGDHAAHALPIARALRAPLFAHEGATLARERRRLDVRPYVPGRPLELGPFRVESLFVPHDAPQVAIRVSAGGRTFALVTDLGTAPKGLRPFLAECDLVFLESNYCPELLEAGPYPPSLRRRVAGVLGHLANAQAADIAASLEDTRVAKIVLVHLSRVNNSPERAHEAVSSRARRVHVDVLPQGETRLVEVSAGSRKVATQMSFGFS